MMVGRSSDESFVYLSIHGLHLTILILIPIFDDRLFACPSNMTSWKRRGSALNHVTFGAIVIEAKAISVFAFRNYFHANQI